MSSRNRKKTATKKKTQHIDDIVIPTFPELKEQKKKKEYEPTERYLCEDCNIYLLYKNVNRHNQTKFHLIK